MQANIGFSNVLNKSEVTRLAGDPGLIVHRCCWHSFLLLSSRMHLYQSVIHPRVDPAYKTVWDTLIKNIAIEAVAKQKQLTVFTHSLWISKASWNKTETTYTQALIWGGIKKKEKIQVWRHGSQDISSDQSSLIRVSPSNTSVQPCTTSFKLGFRWDAKIHAHLTKFSQVLHRLSISLVSPSISAAPDP